MLARVLLAIEDTKLQRHLRRRLSRNDAIVEVLHKDLRLWDRLRREICDLAVVSQPCLPGPVEDLLNVAAEVPDGPAVVVLTDSADSEHRARLLAAGCKAVLDAHISPDSLADVLETLLTQRRQLEQQRLAAPRKLSQPRLGDFVSHSPIMQTFLSMVERVVDSNVSLLILGETGVGKERLARAIHNEGGRSTGPFIAVNCGALPETLLESELFGHEEGSFTGASRSRRGCFELAHGGTVFLDEIGELPHHLQVKLLSVLQEHEFRRLGGERTISVDVRVMAASNRNLEEEVRQDRFRRDLFFRLSVMTLTIPPLCERREDIPDLVHNYIEHLRPRLGREVYSINEDALRAMVGYAWPGNVRELINVVERAMLLAGAEEISLADLPLAISQQAAVPGSVVQLLSEGGGPAELPRAWLERPLHEVRQEVLSQVERAYLKGLLKETRGRIGETARRAGIQPRSLYDKMKHYNLRKEEYRDGR